MDDKNTLDRLREEAEQLGLHESQALVQLMIDLHNQQRDDIRAALECASKSAESAQDAKKSRKVGIICATVCACCVAVLIAILAITAGGVQISEESITQNPGTGNAVYQTGEAASYIDGGETN